MRQAVVYFFVLLSVASAAIAQQARIDLTFPQQPRFVCLPTPIEYQAGGVTVTMSPGELSDEYTGGPNASVVSFKADYICAGIYAGYLTMDFDTPVQNVKLRLIGDGGHSISVNGVQVSPPAVPVGQTNVTVPGPTSRIDIEEQGVFSPSFGWEIIVDTVSFEIAPRPDVVFDYNDAQVGEKLLLHRYRSDDDNLDGGGYPSVYQIPTDPLTQSAQFYFQGKVTAGGQPSAGPLYLRVIDPPDTADYRYYGSSKTPNDNLDTTDPKGQLYYIDAAGQRHYASATGGVLSMPATSDGVTGRFKVYLEASNHIAGENYQVEASTDGMFPCATNGPNGTDSCAKSVMVTTWKRMYIEYDRMFRAGANLSASLPAGTTEIAVGARGSFAKGSRIRLVHAPFLEEASPSGMAFFYSEERTVRQIKGGRRHAVLVLDAPIMHAYAPDPADPLLGDSIGLVDAGVFEPRKDLVKELFDTTFTEYLYLRDDVPGENAITTVPFVESVGFGRFDGQFAQKWCESCVGLSEQSNHWHLIGGNRSSDAGAVGLTRLDEEASFAAPYSYVWVGYIEENVQNNPAYSGLSPILWTQETTVHELTHSWAVDQPIPPGHCNQQDYDGTDSCLMNRVGGDRANGIAKLHAWSDPNCEYRRIRTRDEPMPQTTH